MRTVLRRQKKRLPSDGGSASGGESGQAHQKTLYHVFRFLLTKIL